jgi:Rod binding domain-containing protein
MTQISLSINQVGPLPADKDKASQLLLKELEGIWLSKVVKSAHTPFRANQTQSFAFSTFQDMFDEAMGRAVAEKGVLNLSAANQRQLFPENVAKELKISPESEG